MAPQLAGERGKALGARFVDPGAARPLREGPDALDALVERLAFLAPQRLAEQPAEQAHVVAQRLMRIVLVHAAFDDSGARRLDTSNLVTAVCVFADAVKRELELRD